MVEGSWVPCEGKRAPIPIWEVQIKKKCKQGKKGKPTEEKTRTMWETRYPKREGKKNLAVKRDKFQAEISPDPI